MSDYSAVVFDLDGTLVESSPDIAAALNRVLSQRGGRELLPEEVVPLLGEGTQKLVERATEISGANLNIDLTTLSAEYLGAYLAEPACLSTVFPGVRQALEELRAAGIRLGVCTNKNQDLAETVLDQLGLAEFFSVVVGADSVPEPKPAPGHLLTAFTELGTGPGTLLYIGDSTIDEATARSAGVPFLATAWAPEEIAAPRFDYAKLSETINISAKGHSTVELLPIETPTEQDKAKFAAGRFAAENYIESGMKVGLGSGTTSHYFVRALAERVANGLDIICATTSTSTRDLGLSLGLNVVDLDSLGRLDVTVDGPDEIDANGAMIKGGGACLLWEKLVERVSDKVVIVADSSKAVDTLGAFPLPIEIIKYSPKTTISEVRRVLARHGYEDDVIIERRQRDGKYVITDNGNYVIDVHLGRARDLHEMTVELNEIPGVVENGIFVDITDEVVFGWSDGRAEAHSLPFTLNR